MSRENVTGLLHRLQDFFQIKTENIYLFKIIIKKHGNVFKTWLCPNFLLLPKIWGGCSPPRPPAPYAYGSKVLGRLSNDDSDVNENGKKAIGYFEKQQSCTCITLFYTFLCRHCTPTTWKCLISRFVGDVNTTRRLSFCFLELRYNRSKFNSRTNCASFEEMNEKE